MNKAEFISAIAEKRGITKKEATAVANDVLGIIEDAVASGEGFAITGSFAIKTAFKPAKTQWNEMLQKNITIPAKTVVKLTVGKPLKERAKLLTPKLEAEYNAENSENGEVKPF